MLYEEDAVAFQKAPQNALIFGVLTHSSWRCFSLRENQPADPTRIDRLSNPANVVALAIQQI